MTDYNMTYSTVDSLARYLDNADPTAPVTSANQLQYEQFFDYAQDLIRQASDIIERITNNRFTPYHDTRIYYIEDVFRYRQFYNNELQLDAYLQSVSSVSWIGTTVNSSDYQLLPANKTSKLSIRFNPTAVTTVTTNFGDSISITGIWCDHRAYGVAWQDITTLDANIATSTATTISVASASDFEVLQYIRVNDEMMQVTAVDTDNDNLTVLRGVNGSTATTHTSGDTVESYSPMDAIEMACNRIAGFLYQNRGTAGERIQFPDTQQTINELPSVVRQTLLTYRKPVYLVV